MRSIPDLDHKSATISVLWNVAEGADGIEEAVNRISAEAERAIDDSVRLIILSDRGVDHDHIAIPMLLATGAVHHHLTRIGKRMKCSIICDSGEARDVHQIACLIGYGASAVCPYVAYATIRELLEKGQLGETATYEKMVLNYKAAIEKGLLKIMSKMGISVVDSYRGAQIFEAIGISSALTEKCFTGTPSKIEGIGFKEIATETLTRHRLAYSKAVPEENKIARVG